MEDNEKTFLPPSKVEEDPLTRRIGQIGKWQCVVGIVYGFTIALFAWQSFANKFLAYPVNFSCGNSSEPLSCDSPACEEVIFDESKFSESVVSRWNLICDKGHYPRLAQTLTFVGNLIGALLSGHIADSYGRRTLIIASLFFLGVSGSLGPLAPNFFTWTGLRLLNGLFATSINVGANVYIIEILGGKWRSICSALFGGVPFQLGILSLGALVYLVPNMTHVEYIMGGAAFPICLMWVLLPESPRWCLSVGKHQKAELIAQKVSKFNGMIQNGGGSLTDGHPASSIKESKTIMDLLKLPGLRRNFLIMSLNWFGFTMGYYGLIYNTPPFNFNIYLVFIFPTFFALPLNCLIPFIENKLGRKVLLTSSMLLAGLFQTLSFLFRGTPGAVTLFSVLGTVACFSAMSSGYIYCKELFPTVLRTTALSFATVCARIGSILSPIVASLDTFHPALPIGVYGVVTLATGILSIWLWPETKSIKLPDTLGESEAAASTQNTWVRKCKC